MSWLAIILILLAASIHAIWNLIMHVRKVNATMILRIHWLTALVGFFPILFFELQGNSLSPTIWGLVFITSIFQAFAYLGIMMGYRHGNFSVVYPMTMALPIVFLVFFDIARGHFPSFLGWIGLLLVIIGCVIIPLKSLSTIQLADYWNRSTIWVLVIVFAMVSFMGIDKVAAEILSTSGVETAVRYAFLRSIFIVPLLWFIFKLIKEPTDAPQGIEVWRWSALLALLILGSYSLILVAYRLSPYLSYLSGIVQFSLLMGVVLAALFLKEKVPPSRIIGAIILLVGIICITQTS